MHLRTTEIGRLLAAAHFSADKHRDQRRKGVRNTPYINHPLDVAERLNRIGGIDDLVTLVAALLHDTIEDTETTESEIERAFGREVAGLVAELSDDKSLWKDERKRIEVEHAPRLSPKAKLIKLADKTSNVADLLTNPPPDWTLQRRRDYVDFAEAVAAGCRGLNAALDADFDRLAAAVRAKIG